MGLCPGVNNAGLEREVQCVEKRSERGNVVDAGSAAEPAVGVCQELADRHVLQEGKRRKVMENQIAEPRRRRAVDDIRVGEIDVEAQRTIFAVVAASPCVAFATFDVSVTHCEPGLLWRLTL